MLLIMLLGSMNYNNSMGLGLAFFLGSIALVTMHHCHRNILGLQVMFDSPEPVFAGQNACINVILFNDSQNDRSDLVARIAHGKETAVNLESREHKPVALTLPTSRRGYLESPRLSLRTRYPAGLFRAWTWLYWDLKVLVYPRPNGTQPLPGLGSGQQTGNEQRSSGEDELAELRTYQMGDPLNRVAWKHYARTGDMHSKTLDSPQSTDLWLDWEAVQDPNIEARLEQLCEWVIQSHTKRISYGLRLPNKTINPDHSDAHRARCLRALALFS
ncbi:MAG: DUF58 domain-containing protein [Gammaproteobacteria bacterium]